MTEYRLELARVSIEFEGEKTRHINIEILRGDEWLDCAVLTKEDILWLLGEDSD